jgi:AcrR family transcriptional regulator
MPVRRSEPASSLLKSSSRTLAPGSGPRRRSADGNSHDSRRDAGERRAQVLSTAERLFARRGYDGVGLREIAHEVGIRAPSLFKHFPSKQAIYNLVLSDLFASLAEAIEVAIRGPGDFAARLDRLVIAYIDFLVARPHFPAILFRETLDHPQAIEQPTSARGLEIYGQLEAFLRAGTRAGVFRAMSARHLILGFTGMVTFFHASQSEVTRLDTMVGGRRHEIERWKREAVETMRRAVLNDDGRDDRPHRAGRQAQGPGTTRARK